MTMREKVLFELEAAGSRGVHSFYFYKKAMPTFSQRIGELIRLDGYKIRRVPKGSKGAIYYLEGK